MTAKTDRAAVAEESFARKAAASFRSPEQVQADAASAQAQAGFEQAMERPGVRDRFVANQDAAYDRLVAEWKAGQ